MSLVTINNAPHALEERLQRVERHQLEVISLIGEILERVNNMPTSAEFEALRVSFDETTNRIASGVTAVIAKIAALEAKIVDAGIPGADEGAILNGFTAIKDQLATVATNLEAVGKPNDPSLPPTDPSLPEGSRRNR